MKRIAIVLSILAIAGCGANGAPFTPSANVGLNVGTNGVTTSTNIGASNGTVSVGVSL